jgi:hypothetical protein
MSTSTLSGREGVVLTDPKWHPFTRGMTKWVNRMAGRNDLSVRVLAKTSGAPARFIHSRASIDINEKVLDKISEKIVGSQEFVALYPDEAGLIVHETAGHARNSYLIDLTRIVKVHGPRHASTFKLLEEGRCERQGIPHMTKVELYALRSTVLNILLNDLREETADEQIATSPGKMVLHTLGLVAARVDAGILDVTQPKAHKVVEGLRRGLGEDWYRRFSDVAIEFSKQQIEPWHSDEKRMHELVRDWLELEQEFLGEVEPPQDGTVCGLPTPSPTGTGKGGEETGQGPTGTGSGPQGEPGESRTEPGTGPGKESGTEPEEPGTGQAGEGRDGEPGPEGDGGEDNGESGEDQDGPSRPGMDDDGEPGNGERVLTEDMVDGDDAPDLGVYNGGTSLEEVYRELVKDIVEAGVEAKQVSGHRLGVELKAIHKSNALEHKDRRKRNQEAARLWR